MNRRLQMNPILKKDMLISSRNAKMVIAITLINLICTLVVAGVLISASANYSFQEYYSSVVDIFLLLAICELCVISLVVPIITATSITGERERQTLEIMLTTPVRPFSVVIGKVASATATTLMYVIASMPFLDIAFMVGGLSWSALLKFVGIVVFVDIYVGAFGVFFSSIRRTSVSATISTIAAIAAIVILTFVVSGTLEMFASTYDYRTDTTTYNMAVVNIENTLWAINPVVWIIDVFTKIFYHESVSTYWYSTTRGEYSRFIKEHLALVSVIVNMAISVLLLWLASRRVATGSRRKRKRSKRAEMR